MTEESLETYFTPKYPERGAWKVHGRTHGSNNAIEYQHGGYWSEKLRPCPACGRRPVFEEDAYRMTSPHERAKYFYGYCPTCELRTRESGTLKEAVMQWQEGKFSEASWLHCHRPKLDTYVCSLLCETECREMYKEARFYVNEMQKADQGYDFERVDRLKKDLNMIEDFFRSSPLAFAMDPEAVISKLRKELFPEMTPEERMQIPLKLSKLYNGEEIVKKWREKQRSITKNNS